MLKNTLRMVLGILFYPLIAFTQHVVIENSNGEVYSLYIDPQESFLDVMRSMQVSFIDPDSVSCDVEELQTFKVKLTKNLSLDSLDLDNEQLAKKARATARNYAVEATASERADIAYILSTLANSTLPKIKLAESSLKKAGDRIDAVHPLHFLASIFTDEQLKVCIRNLQGRSWVWKEFFSGVTDTLAEEDARNNVLPFLHDFAAKIKVDVNAILPIAKAKRWDHFVIILIGIVPRQGEINRYNI